MFPTITFNFSKGCRVIILILQSGNLIYFRPVICLKKIAFQFISHSLATFVHTYI